MVFAEDGAIRVVIGFGLLLVVRLTGHTEFVNESQLWALVAYTIFASAVLQGTTSFLVGRFTSR